MLNSQRPARLFGLGYGTIFVGLAIAVAVLVALLLLNLPHTQDATVTGGNKRLDPTDWIKLLVLFSFLLITATASVVTVYSYLVTTAKLARVQTTAKAILESLVGGVLTLDTEGRITIINRAAGRILDVSADPPYPSLDELSPELGVLVALIRSALGVREDLQDQDSLFINSRHEQIILRTSISEQVDEAGRRVGIVVLVKDVSRLVAMENELRKRDRLATAGTLAAGVAHEIRNPLSALELNIRLLRDEVEGLHPISGEIEGYFEVLFAETRRLNRITSNFLELSRPQPVVKSRLAFHNPVLQVVRLLEREAAEKKISLLVDLAAGDPMVMGDSTKLEQLCLNILINAMQAMPDGGVIRITSSVSSADNLEFVNLSFADQGIGIPPENLARLFDPYFTTRTDGTGLGLAIADRIVTDHGGRILVESTSGMGTVMTISLPLATAKDVPVEQGLGA